jgi:hypothetical protein
LRMKISRPKWEGMLNGKRWTIKKVKNGVGTYFVKLFKSVIY